MLPVPEPVSPHHESAKPSTKSDFKAFYNTLSKGERVALIAACALAMVSAAALIATIIVFPPVGVVAMGGAFGLSAEALVMVPAVTAIATSIISTGLIKLVNASSSKPVKTIIQKINFASWRVQEQTKKVNKIAERVRWLTNKESCSPIKMRNVIDVQRAYLRCLCGKLNKARNQLSRNRAEASAEVAAAIAAGTHFEGAATLRAPVPPFAVSELHAARAEFNALHDAPHDDRIAAAQRLISAATVVRDTLNPYNGACARNALYIELDAEIAVVNAEIRDMRAGLRYAELGFSVSSVREHNARRGSI